MCGGLRAISLPGPHLGLLPWEQGGQICCPAEPALRTQKPRWESSTAETTPLHLAAHSEKLSEEGWHIPLGSKGTTCPGQHGASLLGTRSQTPQVPSEWFCFGGKKVWAWSWWKDGLQIEEVTWPFLHWAIQLLSRKSHFSKQSELLNISFMLHQSWKK